MSEITSICCAAHSQLQLPAVSASATKDQSNIFFYVLSVSVSATKLIMNAAIFVSVCNAIWKNGQLLRQPHVMLKMLVLVGARSEYIVKLCLNSSSPCSPHQANRNTKKKKKKKKKRKEEE